LLFSFLFRNFVTNQYIYNRRTSSITLNFKLKQMTKIKKTRYKLFNGETLIGEASSVDGIAALLGCTRRHIEKQTTEGNTFKFLRVTYTIIDKLNN